MDIDHDSTDARRADTVARPASADHGTSRARVADAARALAATLDRPIFNRTLGKEVGRGDLDYEIYLGTRTLYGLQTPASELSTHDEHLFQVLHQAQELWLKASAFEVVSLIEQLDAGDLFDAVATLGRVVEMNRVLATEIRVLYTMTPDAFHVVRRNLGSGSGLESPGYNRALVAAEAARQALQRLLERRGLTLAELYVESEKVSGERAGVRKVVELFLDWDEAFQAWLVAHFMLVRRTIGIHRTVKALDGYPTHSLAPRMTSPLFPELWDVRVDLTKAWKREGGYAPGAPRHAASATPPPPSATADAPRVET